MLDRKIDTRLTKTVIEPAKALEFSGEAGTIMSLSASWHRTVEKDEQVDMAEFMFLLVDGGKPKQVEVSYEKGKFSKNVTDLSKEMGDMSEEEAFARQVKFLTDGEVLKLLEGSPRMEKALKKARHLRVYSMDFVVFDDTYQAPVWHVVLKNWPLTNFFKREKPLSVEAVVEATRGKIISLAVYDMK